MALSAVISAAISGRAVRAALLARFDFASGTERVWAGEYPLTTRDGAAWKALGILGSVEGLNIRTDMAADQLVFRLSGVDADLIRLAQNSSAEVRGRPCAVYLQFFDEDWALLDDPLAVRSAIMDTMSYKAVGPDQRQITLKAEGIFAARNSAPFAYYTDRDQQSRYPGDTFLKLIPSLLVKQVTWPDY